MDRQIMPGKPAPQLRDLGAGDTFSIVGRGGSVVRVLQGRAWITQEGDARDYVVPAGTRFCAARSGRIVVSAVADGTRIAIDHVRPLPAGDWTHNQVRLEPDFVAIVLREARRQQVLYFAERVSGLWRRIRQAWARRALPRRSSAVLPPQARGYHC